MFFALVIILAAAAFAGYLANSFLYFVFLFAALILIPVAYVLLWKIPKMEAIKALCVVLAAEGVPLLAMTGYAIVPLASVYLANRKQTNGKRGVVIVCLMIGILYILASFITK